MPDIKSIADRADIVARNSEFIKDHYQEMYLRWSQYSEKGFYKK